MNMHSDPSPSVDEHRREREGAFSLRCVLCLLKYTQNKFLFICSTSCECENSSANMELSWDDINRMCVCNAQCAAVSVERQQVIIVCYGQAMAVTRVNNAVVVLMQILDIRRYSGYDIDGPEAASICVRFRWPNGLASGIAAHARTHTHTHLQTHRELLMMKCVLCNQSTSSVSLSSASASAPLTSSVASFRGTLRYHFSLSLLPHFVIVAVPLQASALHLSYTNSVLFGSIKNLMTSSLCIERGISNAEARDPPYFAVQAKS